MCHKACFSSPPADDAAAWPVVSHVGRGIPVPLVLPASPNPDQGRPREERRGLTLRGAGWWAVNMAGPAGFVGREGELSRLLGALGGDARMVVVRGECLPLAGTLPLLPVRVALGELAALDSGGLLAATLDAAPGYVRGEVARLLPGMGQDGGTGPDGRDGEWSRERLFAGVAEVLTVVAERSGPGVGLV